MDSTKISFGMDTNHNSFNEFYIIFGRKIYYRFQLKEEKKNTHVNSEHSRHTNFDSENCTIHDEYLLNYSNFINKSLTNAIFIFDNEFIEIF